MTFKGSSSAVSRLAAKFSGVGGWSHEHNSPHVKTTRPVFIAESSLETGRQTFPLRNCNCSISCCTGGGHASMSSETATAKNSSGATPGADAGAPGGFGAAKGIAAGAGAFGASEGSGEPPGDLPGEKGSGAAPAGFGRFFGSDCVTGCFVKCEAPCSGVNALGAGKGMEPGAAALGAANPGGATGAIFGGAAAGAGAEIRAGVGVGAAIGLSGSAATDTAGLTTLAALNGRTLPKILVTLSGTAVTFCPGRRASIAGSMDARICGNGKLTGVLSWLALSAKVPGGDPCRSAPKGILTAPDASCASAVFTGSANAPPPGETTSAARLGESPATIVASGNWIIPSAPANAGAAAAGAGLAAGPVVATAATGAAAAASLKG